MENPYQSPAEAPQAAVSPDGAMPSVPVFLVGGMLTGCKAAAVLFPMTYLIAGIWTGDGSLTTHELVQRLFGQAVGGGVIGLVLGVHMGLIVAVVGSGGLRGRIPLPHLRGAITAIGGLVGAFLAGVFAYFGGSKPANVFSTEVFWLLLAPCSICCAYCCFRLSRLHALENRT